MNGTTAELIRRSIPNGRRRRMATAWMKSRAWLAGLLVLGVTGFASAQVFQLSTDPDKLKDETSQSVSVRPNTPEGRYLFLRNPKADKATYIVELRDAGNRALLAKGTMKMTSNQLLRVKLEKTPPPPPPKTAAPVTPPAPPVTPPPPPAPNHPRALNSKRETEASDSWCSCSTSKAIRSSKTISQSRLRSRSFIGSPKIISAIRLPT